MKHSHVYILRKLPSEFPKLDLFYFVIILCFNLQLLQAINAENEGVRTFSREGSERNFKNSDEVKFALIKTGCSPCVY